MFLEAAVILYSSALAGKIWRKVSIAPHHTSYSSFAETGSENPQTAPSPNVDAQARRCVVGTYSNFDALGDPSIRCGPVVNHLDSSHLSHFHV